MTKEQKLREAVFLYIEAMKRLTNCRQEHFRQVCHTCKKYAGCLVYSGYVEAWMNLQKSYYPEKTVEHGTIEDVVVAAQKLAEHTKDEALSIALNGLCGIIGQQQTDITKLKEKE